jgi:5-methylcytosine-specific restriction enzyme subunit McrC
VSPISLVEGSKLDSVLLTGEEVATLRQSGLVEVAPAWEPGHYTLTARPVVGRIPLPTRSLMILPKTPVSNLFAMLAHTAGQPHLLPEASLSATGFGEGDQVLLGLADMYAQMLDQYLASGAVRRSVTVTEATPYVRGKLLLAPTLRQPPARSHLPITRHTEWSVDNLVNQLLKQAARVALAVSKSSATTLAPPSLEGKSLPPRKRGEAGGLGQSAARRLDRALYLLHEVADTTLSEAAFEQVALNRLETGAAPALALARWLIAGSAPALDSGSRPFPALWLALAHLFERFVACLLRDELRDTRVLPQRSTPLDQAGQVALRPDLILQRDGCPPLVLDTKYKLPGPPVPADLYQLVTYCQALGASHGVLVYPAPTDTPAMVVRQSALTLHALALDLGATPADFSTVCAAFVARVRTLVD